MSKDVMNEFRLVWEQSDTPPDVLGFLSLYAKLDRGQQLLILLMDQQYRWKTKEPLTVEDYVQMFPGVADSSDAKLQLAVGEYQARNGDTSLNLADFTARFSDIGDTLRAQIESEGQMQSTVAITPKSTSVAASVGKYKLLRILGEGAFGRVFLGFDEDLQRQVAIKIPKPERFSSPIAAEGYLAEARMVASLDHPHIVPVHDFGRDDNGAPYVVSKFIEGRTLSEQLNNGRLGFDESTNLLVTVAQALDHAHQKRLIHRDVKPSNILIEDGTNAPYVTDFGLAIREDDYFTTGKLAGTPSYMSPEQARGEGHRLDPRSDIFSLGVVLYELLTGSRPFEGSTNNEILHQVVSVDPTPPRELDTTIPEELERICLKALSKRASDRYNSTLEFAEELSHWKRDPQDAPSDRGIVPRGLRAFSSEDTDFFLDLLPGPRGRDGLPESIRFWKTRIEETDSDKTFSVGLIYGPSGCGKSSLVKAGLLPRLSNVTAIYVEATPGETETRILRRVRKQLPDIPANLGLVETFAAMRRSEKDKVVIVIDQFEQWLHAHRAEENADLVNALRQCNGESLQTIVMVRDDFSMAASRFMRALEARIIEGHNFATVDLFDTSHAQKVLIKFGRAFGKLPKIVAEISDQQRAFVNAVVSGLARDGKVVSVRLALFAEMIKAKEWEPGTLDDVGGTEGVGINFLEETFNGRESNPEHKLHQSASRGVLKALLPELGTNIKGHMKSHSELLDASGYGNRPTEFYELLRILDGELRLITPTDPEGLGSESGSEPGSQCYQLTHDYLVPSLREWLTRKQKESRRGRAELTLAERWLVWNAKPENRHLPSLLEWFNIRSLTNPASWNAGQKRMMATADRVHGLRCLFGAIVVSLLFAGGYGVARVANDRRSSAEASRLVDGLLTAESSQVGKILEDLAEYRQWANDDLATAYAESAEGSNAKLYAAIALLPSDKTALPYVANRLVTVSPTQFEHVCLLLKDYQQAVTPIYQAIAADVDNPPEERFQAACALANFAPDDPMWDDDAFCRFVTTHMVSVLPSELLPWQNALRPAGHHLVTPLGDIFRDPAAAAQRRSFATDTLVDYLSASPESLFELLADASEVQFPIVYDRILAHQETAIELGNVELAKKITADASEEEKETFGRRQANIAIMLLRMNAPDNVWPLLAASPDARIRSYIADGLSLLGGDPQIVLERYQTDDDISVRCALLFCLGEFDHTHWTDEQRSELSQGLLDVYRDHPDRGLHTAVEWLLRRWGYADQLAAIDETEVAKDEHLGREWFVNSEGHTMVILGPATFQMGSPPDEADRHERETRHERTIPHRFAIATKEINKSQWRVFYDDTDIWDPDQTNIKLYSPTDDSPVISMTWYEAAAYCNWLSKREGIDPDEWCYEANDNRDYGAGMKVRDPATHHGYRLPTEAEWEYACRGGTETARYFGGNVKLLPKYTWYQPNSENHIWPVGMLKPNDFGMYDMLGNATEWILDSYYPYSGEDREYSEEVVNNNVLRQLRGGSFFDRPRLVRAATRLSFKPDTRLSNFSFRLARTLPPE